MMHHKALLKRRAFSAFAVPHFLGTKKQRDFPQSQIRENPVSPFVHFEGVGVLVFERFLSFASERKAIKSLKKVKRRKKIGEGSEGKQNGHMSSSRC